jgi:regulation of enolase protein 1 (concanavalin A-like superfamily)
VAISEFRKEIFADKTGRQAEHRMVKSAFPLRPAGLPAALGLLLVTVGWVALAGGGDQERVLWAENFAGRLEPGWSWVREEPGAWRLEGNALLIRTSAGGLAKQDNNNRNLLVRAAPVPVAKDGGVAAEVRVELEPVSPFEHAGLLYYGDDDNYVMLNRELVAKRPIVQLVYEIEGKPKWSFAEKPWPDKAVWLRLEVLDGKARGLVRASEAEAWQLLGECELPAKGERRFALATGYAKGNEDRWSRFEKFRVVEIGAAR